MVWWFIRWVWVVLSSQCGMLSSNLSLVFSSWGVTSSTTWQRTLNCYIWGITRSRCRLTTYSLDIVTVSPTGTGCCPFLCLGGVAGSAFLLLWAAWQRMGVRSGGQCTSPSVGTGWIRGGTDYWWMPPADGWLVMGVWLLPDSQRVPYGRCRCWRQGRWRIYSPLLPSQWLQAPPSPLLVPSGALLPLRIPQYRRRVLARVPSSGGVDGSRQGAFWGLPCCGRGLLARTRAWRWWRPLSTVEGGGAWGLFDISGRQGASRSRWSSWGSFCSARVNTFVLPLVCLCLCITSYVLSDNLRFFWNNNEFFSESWPVLDGLLLMSVTPSTCFLPNQLVPIFFLMLISMDLWWRGGWSPIPLCTFMIKK